MRQTTKASLAVAAIAGLGLVISPAVFAKHNAHHAKQTETVSAKQAEAMDGESAFLMDSKGGIKIFDKKHHGYSFEVSGRLHIDEVMFGGNAFSRSGYPSGANIRRADLAFKGTLGCGWGYVTSLEFGAGGASSFGDTYLHYSGFENLDIVVGQFSAPVSMSANTSSNNLMMMERPLEVSALTAYNNLGIQLGSAGQMFTVRAAVFSAGDDASVDTASLTGSDNLGVAGRVTFAPIHTEDYAVHFGASGLYQDLHKTNNSLSFSTRPEMRGRVTPVISSNITANTARNYVLAGAELGLGWGPVTFQSEYMHVHVDARSGTVKDYGFRGYHTTLGYMLTGESRAYNFKKGTFEAVKPASNMGAVEVVGHYSFLNLDDNNSGASLEHNVGFGINWFMTDNVRLMANYIHADIDNHAAAINDRKLDIVGMRLQASF